MLPLVSEFSWRYAEILYVGCVNPHFWCQNMPRSYAIRENKTQLKIFLAYFNTNADNRGSTSWDHKWRFHFTGNSASSAIFWPEFTTSSTTSFLEVEYPKSTLLPVKRAREWALNSDGGCSQPTSSSAHHLDFLLWPSLPRSPLGCSLIDSNYRLIHDLYMTRSSRTNPDTVGADLPAP